MRGFQSKAVVGLAVAGMMVSLVGTDASAETARHLYRKGHSGYYGHHYRTYGRSNVGPAIAGAALGVIGLAAGAAAANAYERDDYAPGYAYGGYGYAPPPYAYGGGYGYGYAPY